MSGDYDFVNYDWEGIVFGPLKGKLRYAGGDVEELKALARFLRPWPRETAEEHERRINYRIDDDNIRRMSLRDDLITSAGYDPVTKEKCTGRNRVSVSPANNVETTIVPTGSTEFDEMENVALAEAAEGLVDLSTTLENTTDLPPPMLPKKIKSLGAMPIQPIIPPLPSTDIGKKTNLKKKGILALQARVDTLEAFINDVAAPFMTSMHKASVVYGKEASTFMKNQSDRIKALEVEVSKAQAEVNGKDIIIAKTKVAIEAMKVKGNGYHAELKQLRVTFSKVPSTGESKIDEQIRFIEAKTQAQVNLMEQRAQIKLATKEDEYEQKMSREDRRANQKTGGAIKNHMTTSGEWSLKSALQLAQKRKSDYRDDDYDNNNYNWTDGRTNHDNDWCDDRRFENHDDRSVGRGHYDRYDDRSSGGRNNDRGRGGGGPGRGGEGSRYGGRDMNNYGRRQHDLYDGYDQRSWVRDRGFGSGCGGGDRVGHSRESNNGREQYGRHDDDRTGRGRYRDGGRGGAW